MWWERVRCGVSPGRRALHGLRTGAVLFLRVVAVSVTEIATEARRRGVGNGTEKQFGNLIAQGVALCSLHLGPLLHQEVEEGGVS